MNCGSPPRKAGPGSFGRAGRGLGPAEGGGTARRGGAVTTGGNRGGGGSKVAGLGLGEGFGLGLRASGSPRRSGRPAAAPPSLVSTCGSLEDRATRVILPECWASTTLGTEGAGTSKVTATDPFPAASVS